MFDKLYIASKIKDFDLGSMRIVYIREFKRNRIHKIKGGRRCFFFYLDHKYLPLETIMFESGMITMNDKILSPSI